MQQEEEHREKGPLPFSLVGAGVREGVGRRGDYLRDGKKKTELNFVPASPWRLFSFDRKIPKNIIFITLCLSFSGRFMLWLILQYLSYKANGGFMVRDRG